MASSCPVSVMGAILARNIMTVQPIKYPESVCTPNHGFT